MNKLLDAADHPITFVLFITLAVFGVRAMFVYGAKRVGAPGVAAFFK